MSHRARAAKTSASPKKKSIPTRNTIQKKIPVKKSSPTKPHLEQTSSSTIIQPRQKRLSSLTAATLLQYCTSILSPSRKLKPIKQSPKDEKTNQSTTSRKRPVSNISENNKTESHIPTRTRREASSRASAMIMQQNEIERSRYNYFLDNKHSTSTIRRHRSKSTITDKDNIPPEPFKFSIPSIPPPPIVNVSDQTEYTQPLTETILAEHDRLHETIPSYQTTKHDHLLKWTQELALCGCLSPPYPEDEIPSESSIHSKTKELTSSSIIADSKSLDSSSSVNISSHLSTTTNIPTPTFLFPSSTYPLDLRSFYPLLPCWPYPNWPFQSSSINSKTSLTPPETKPKKSIISIHKQKKEALTLHLHTHHHHHIHNTSSLLNPTKIPSSSEKLSNSKNQLLETKTILPLNVNNVDQVLNLSTNIKKTTRRKSSPVKRLIDSGTKSNSLSIADNSNLFIEKSTKRRSVSAATTNTTTIVSITGRNSRGKRTISATNRKRSYSPASITLPLSNNNQKKKQKVSHHWILFGKSEQKLVAIHADKLPVFRECYSSIRHITEKDVIKSNDCIILRSETGTRTPYLAKVKWFWKEPITGEIQMSILWYYHPEHTELSSHIKEQFFPNELLASKYWDCISVECIEDKCYVLNLNEYNRYYLREKSVNLFEHSESIGQLKFLLNKNTPTIHHRPLPAKTVGNQNIFFCRYVYDYRAKRILKNPTFVNTASSM